MDLYYIVHCDNTRGYIGPVLHCTWTCKGYIGPVLHCTLDLRGYIVDL